MKSLATVVEREFEHLLTTSRQAFSGLPRLSDNLELTEQSKKDILQAKRRAEEISRTVKDWQSDESTEPIEPGIESLRAVGARHHQYQKLETILPTEKDVEVIKEFLNEWFSQTYSGKRLINTLQLSGFYALRAGIATAGAIAAGANHAAAEYAIAAASSIAYRTTRDPKYVLSIGLGALAGGIAYAIQIYTDPQLKTYIQHHPISTVFANAMVAGMGIAAAAAIVSGPTRVVIGSKSRLMKDTRDIFNSATRLEIIIEEANRASRTIRKIEQKTNSIPEEVASQAAKLDQTLTLYSKGKVSYAAVEAARISYVPAQITTKTTPTNGTSVVRPTSNLSYQEIKRREAEEEAFQARKRRAKAVEEQAVVVGPTNGSTDTVTVELSDKLQSAYKSSRARVGNYPLQPVIDMARQKIEQNPRSGTVIRRTTDGKYLVNELTRKHNLPPNTTIYKMQPTGFLRALYTVDGNQVKLLEILTHAEYDAKLDKR